LDLLLVDIGNSQIKRCVVKGGVLGTVICDPTLDIDRVANEIAGWQLPVSLSCVYPGAAKKLKAILQNHASKFLVEINSLIDKPISGFYGGMGADRIANVAGAWVESSGKCPVAAIDLGTATTITTASGDGKFAGGFTTLGLGGVCKSLPEALPALPIIDPHKIDNLEPGFDVYSTLCRGTVSAHVGVIEKWINIFRGQLGQNLAVTVTGGWSKIVSPFLAPAIKIDPLLTLKGIWTISKIYS